MVAELRIDCAKAGVLLRVFVDVHTRDPLDEHPLRAVVELEYLGYPADAAVFIEAARVDIGVLRVLRTGKDQPVVGVYRFIGRFRVICLSDIKAQDGIWHCHDAAKSGNRQAVSQIIIHILRAPFGLFSVRCAPRSAQKQEGAKLFKGDYTGNRSKLQQAK